MSEPYALGGNLPAGAAATQTLATSEPLIGVEETRHFIGLTRSRMRVSAAIEAAFRTDPTPFPMGAAVGLDALAEETVGQLLYPVSATIAAEWNTDADLDGLVNDLLDAVDAQLSKGCPASIVQAARALRTALNDLDGS